jgi:hypothetical protein
MPTHSSAFTLAVALSLGVVLSAQSDDRRPKTATLTGCVERGSTPTQYTITDQLNGKYEVTGSQIGRYLGQRVQIAGSPNTSRLRIKGGLYPNPNVAGQAGAMDPGRAAVAAMPGGPGSGTGDIALPTFKVKSVRMLSGGCG